MLVIMSGTQIAVFNPDQESIEEFMERLKVQAVDLLTTKDYKKNATVLVKALPINAISDLQRRLKPKILSSATFAELEALLTQSYEDKKSLIGATVKFLSFKQKSDELNEHYARALNNLWANCQYQDCCCNRLLCGAFLCGLRARKILSALLQDCVKKNFNE